VMNLGSLKKLPFAGLSYVGFNPFYGSRGSLGLVEV